MQIDIPRRLNRDTMYVLLKKVINRDNEPIDDEVLFNFETLTAFIEPSGVTILSNLIHWLEFKGVNVLLLPGEIKPWETPNKFLDDSMFFKEHLGEVLDESAAVRATTFPLKQVNAHSPIPLLVNEFTPWLSRQLNINPKQLATVQVCIEEVLNNIRDHAHRATGCIFAQYTPNNHEVLISISDFGVGIPYNVQRVLPTLNDYEALRQAVVRGFSTKSTDQNYGYGLDNLIHNVVVNGKGAVYIHSLNGMMACKNVNNAIEHRPRGALGYYPGTLIDIVIKTDVEDIFDIVEEGFSWEDEW
ncbi:ATP-binding protein [Heyndrickxia ginsengihumi]|uniref:ATP-binding protein n=1 Tax=Heyndrickxia ginsengihumi TaxID=363870 RepID=UPI003D24C17E